jgi:hypothetical protein
MVWQIIIYRLGMIFSCIILGLADSNYSVTWIGAKIFLASMLAISILGLGLSFLRSRLMPYILSSLFLLVCALPITTLTLFMSINVNSMPGFIFQWILLMAVPCAFAWHFLTNTKVKNYFNV